MSLGCVQSTILKTTKSRGSRVIAGAISTALVWEDGPTLSPLVGKRAEHWTSVFSPQLQSNSEVTARGR